MKQSNKLSGLEIAVIGMAGRFPGARNIDEFRRNLEEGVESIAFFSREELAGAGVSSGQYDSPNYVAAFGVMPDKDCFDALFFGYTPGEAEVMDPQVRIFQEVSWGALEHAGYVPDTYNGLIGVYAGAGGNFYWEARSVLSGKDESVGSFEAALLNNKDFLSTRVSYKLDLKGPSFTLYTACSSSLAAIHMAARALLTGECGMALAGGITAVYPDNFGYFSREGMINSPDGHCRVFDARSRGTVFGDGVGVVVLKRLADALRDGDTVHAMIKASAVNNDGMRKVGFAAPSTAGQAEVIRAALKIGKIPAESITYIEAHGTGTAMGDTMEIEAVKSAFRPGSDKKGRCAVGSVKSNIGHLDAAAGAAGFIKTVLALKHRRIPPTLHYEAANPNIDFDDSPFYVNTTLLEWKNDEYPLRAGVSSFGIGGTNAHVILEEAPVMERVDSPPFTGETGKGREYQLIVLSARTPFALDKMSENLADHLKKYPGINLADAAYTLQVGRKAFKYRRMLVCGDVEDALDRLQAAKDSGKSYSYTVELTEGAAAETTRFDEEINGPGKEDEPGALLKKLGFQWLRGETPDWQALHKGHGERFRIPLPTYPFERKTIPVEKNLSVLTAAVQPSNSQLARKSDMADWFYLPGWKPSILPLPMDGEEGESKKNSLKWLLFDRQGKLAEVLIRLLEQKGHTAASVKPGRRFGQAGENRYTLDPEKPEDYEALFNELAGRKQMPDHILHLWNVGNMGSENLVQAQHLGFYSLLHIIRALQQQGIERDLCLTVVTTGMQEVAGEGVQSPEKATLLGALKVIPQEHPFIRCCSIDVEPVEPEQEDYPVQQLAGLLARELALDPEIAPVEPEIAYRGFKRWVRSYEPVRLERIAENHKRLLPLKKRGVYLITGGLGGMGLALAEYLAREWQARLVLVSRTSLPPRDRWENSDDRRVKKVRHLESLGAEVLTAAADAAHSDRMREVVEQAEARFGPVNGVIHAAGVLSGRSFQAAARLTVPACQEQFSAKIHGLLALEQIFLPRQQDNPLDFFVVASSIAALLGGVGFAAYAAGNLFMDAYARHRNPRISVSLPWLVVNWDSWLFDDEKIHKGIAPGELLMTPEEGVEAFCRILAHPDIHQVVHSLGDLQVRIDRWIKLEFLRQETGSSDRDGNGSDDSRAQSLRPRPDLMTPYTAPRTPVEETLADIWQKFFGFEKIGVQDNFFELGGDSLKVLTMVARIHKRWNVEIPVTDFFQNPFIEGIARLIEGAETTPYTCVTPAEEKEYYPLSPAQKRLFIIQQMEKQSTGYNETMLFSMEGDPDRERLAGVFRELSRRHESFRTSFFVMGDQPVQAVRPAEAVEFKMEFFDLSESRLDEEGVLRSFSRAFDLAKPPLFRAALLKKEENRCILAVEMHHIISDGLSYQVFIQELAALYEGKIILPGLTLRYRDFAQWQNSEDQQKVIKKQEEYWLKRFEGKIPRLNLPYDHPRPTIKRFEGNSVRFYLTAAETAALKTMAREEEVTLFMVLLAFFYIWMFKLSGQEDIIVGTPVFGRDQEELQQIIGMFVNTLALRNFPNPEETFGQFLKEVRESTLEAFANQDYPFEELADKRGGERDASRNPLFDVLFTLQNVEQQPLDLPEIRIPGLKLSPYTTHELQQAQFDLLMFAHESGNMLGFKVVYSTDLFEQETVERLNGYFKEIATAVLENKHVRLKDIKISHQLETAELDIPDTEFDF